MKKNKEVIGVCKGCLDAIYELKDWDEERGLCFDCIRERDTKVCLKCGKGRPEEQYWGECKSCFSKRPHSKPSDALKDFGKI
jgi:predicted amidophosphoribosyltransferase